MNHFSAVAPAVAPSMPGRSGGVVLLSVLLIVALLSALAVRMTSRHALIVAQARQVLGADLTLQYALGAEAFVRQLLREDWERDQQNSKGPVDHLGEPWAQPLQPFELNEYEDAFLEIQVRDLGNCFNLNSLAGSNGTANLQRLKTLLKVLNLPQNIADLWMDWVDTEEGITGAGAEDGDYLLEPVAYRAANRMAGDVSELYLLKDVDPQQIAQLIPYVCALPNEELAVNVNTATPQVLSGLIENPNEAQLQSIANGERSYQQVSEATKDIPLLQDAADVLTTASRYFELRARVQIDDNVTEITSMLERKPEAGTLHLLRRDFGRAFVSLYQQDEEEP